ncbi:hypothetical protein GCM10011507_22200 [Edaphobacter acidisoli]|uniref:Uncharacterized protein n=1 Tax=Edaphobacter acidisoli TaxID=2040573 RepID=A0A916RTZ6_9BACT|nr:hypothetical protein GCM10011507_22200 [Edaphobacter acidisoli]
MRQEDTASLSETNAATQAIEELRAKVFFKLEYLLRERGLGDLAAFSGTAEAARFGDSRDVA